MKKRRKELPEISTASLPDIIFMLLFFFMVVTVLRNESPKVDFELPTAENIRKIEQNKHFAYVYIGRKDKANRGIAIQLNDQFVDKDNIEEAFVRLVNDPEIDKSSFEVSLKADRYTSMKLIRSVKIAMQKAGIRHLVYLSERKV